MSLGQSIKFLFEPEQVNLKSLIGETLTHVDQSKNEEIMLTTESGRTIHIYHSQDCCESVNIEDTEGNWHEIIGKVIIDASEEIVKQKDNVEYWESCTKTALTFKVDGATVISRWIGTSNGYYSETVDIEEISGKV